MHRADNFTTFMCRLLKSESLNLLEPSGPVQACNGIALPLPNYIEGNSRGIVSHGPPLWSSGQSVWLQTQRSRVRFPALPDFLSSGLERGPLSLVRSIEEILE